MNLRLHCDIPGCTVSCPIPPSAAASPILAAPAGWVVLLRFPDEVEQRRRQPPQRPGLGNYEVPQPLVSFVCPAHDLPAANSSPLDVGIPVVAPVGQRSPFGV